MRFCRKLESAGGCCSFVAERLEASGFQRLLSRARCSGMWLAAARQTLDKNTKVPWLPFPVFYVNFSGKSESLIQTDDCLPLIVMKRCSDSLGVNIGGSPRGWGGGGLDCSAGVGSAGFWVKPTAAAPSSLLIFWNLAPIQCEGISSELINWALLA